MQSANIDRATGIIEVKRSDPTDLRLLEHCGMAILISPRVAITCAHVVNAAIPRMIEAEEPPPDDTRIALRFPMVPGGKTYFGRITKWGRVGPNPLEDMAVLELERQAPPEAGVAVLAVIAQERDDGGILSLFGVRHDREMGEHATATLLGKSSGAWRQIRMDRPEGVEPGFSGAAVWNAEHQAVVGMAVRRQDADVAFFVPSDALIRFAGDVPHERRTLSSVFARAFTLFGGAFFAAALCHLLADRMKEFPTFLSLGFGNEILSAFWGLHLVVLCMPLLLWRLLSFADAYREHPWWMRLPQFGHLGAPARPAAGRFIAVATLLLLVVGPLYLSGHFMRRLHSNEMKVYIDAKAFGLDPSMLMAAGESCGTVRSSGYCTHPDAGLYSLASSTDPGKGGYWDNYYHIGGLDRRIPATVTFYPVVQPIILWALMALCFVLSGLLAFRLARPASRLIVAPFSSSDERRMESTSQ